MTGEARGRSPRSSDLIVDATGRVARAAAQGEGGNDRHGRVGRCCARSHSSAPFVLECGDFVTAFTAGGAGERATQLHACGSTRAAAPRQVEAVSKSPHSIPLPRVVSGTHRLTSGKTNRAAFRPPDFPRFRSG
jgi:hypothetical protein